MKIISGYAAIKTHPGSFFNVSKVAENHDLWYHKAVEENVKIGGKQWIEM